jgi:hypothetical protein
MTPGEPLDAAVCGVSQGDHIKIRNRDGEFVFDAEDLVKIKKELYRVSIRGSGLLPRLYSVLGSGVMGDSELLFEHPDARCNSRVWILDRLDSLENLSGESKVCEGLDRQLG